MPAKAGYLLCCPKSDNRPMLKNVLRLIPLLLMSGVAAFAQSNLPSCPSNGLWNNCQGTYIHFANDQYIGDKYVGEFKEGKPNGKGTYYHMAPNSHRGGVYVGEFKEGLREGRGEYTGPDGSIYVATWKAGAPSGEGIYQGKAATAYGGAGDAIRFSGQYQNGVFSGSGKVKTASKGAERPETIAGLAVTIGSVANIKAGATIGETGADLIPTTSTQAALDDSASKARQEQERLQREVKEQARLKQQEDERLAKLNEETRLAQERKQKELLDQVVALEAQRSKSEAEAANRLQAESLERLRLERLAAEKRQRDLEEQLQMAQLQLIKQQLAAPQKTLDAHALVIGNSSYPGNVLANPANDARAMANKLREMGFKVTEALDVDRVRFSNTLSQFARSAAYADVTLLFYAGHGSQISGTNYMLPIDLNMSDLGQVPLFGIALNSVVEHYLPGKTKLVFLDACRDNPLIQVASRSVAKGLAPMAVSEGTLIAYATKDGQVAQDGVGSKNSPFTSALLEHIGDPDDIAVVLRKVRDKVMRSTGGKQQPWEYGSLTGGALVLAAIKPK